MSDNAAHQPQYSPHPQPGPPAQPGAAAQPAYGRLLPSGPDRPAPLGLGLAGVGLLLLAVGSLIPQVSLGGGDADEAGAFLFSNVGVSLPGLSPALILLVLVGWAAAGIKPGLQWAVKLGGIGLAVLTAAAALHPVIELNSSFGSEAFDDVDIEASAGGGVWLYILAAIMLAVSIFLMRWAPQPQQQAPAPQYAQRPQSPQQPQPAQQPQPTQQQSDNGWPGYTQQ